PGGGSWPAGIAPSTGPKAASRRAHASGGRGSGRPIVHILGALRLVSGARDSRKHARVPKNKPRTQRVRIARESSQVQSALPATVRFRQIARNAYAPSRTVPRTEAAPREIARRTIR